MSGFRSVISLKALIDLPKSGRKGDSKLSKSIHKSIKDFYDTGSFDHYQFLKSYKMAVSFVLSSPLSTVSKLHSTSINAFSIKHISTKTTVSPFSKTVFPMSKSFVPEDKPANNLVILM